MLANQSKERAVSIPQQSAEKTVAGVDPSWKGLYRVGGISAILYIVLALVGPTISVLTMGYFEIDCGIWWAGIPAFYRCKQILVAFPPNPGVGNQHPDDCGFRGAFCGSQAHR